MLSTTCVVNIIISYSCSVRVLAGNFHPSGDNNK